MWLGTFIYCLYVILFGLSTFLLGTFLLLLLLLLLLLPCVLFNNIFMTCLL